MADNLPQFFFFKHKHTSSSCFVLILLQSWFLIYRVGCSSIQTLSGVKAADALALIEGEM